MAAGEKLLDHGQDPVGIGEPGVVPALDFEQPRTGDVVGEVPAALYRNDFVAGVDDQGGNGDRRQDRPHINPKPRFERRARHPRAGAHALHHCERADRPHRRQQSFGRLAAAPRRDGGAAPSLPAGELLHRGRVDLTQLVHEARPQLGRIAVQVIPAVGEGVRGGAVKNQRPRSLRSCCREEDGGRAAIARPEKHRSFEAGGVHDSLDLGRPIVQRANMRDRVRQPGAGLVEQKDATERGEPLEEGHKFGHGPVQLDVAGERPGKDELDRPVPKHLIRQAQIAAGCVRRFRHGIERTADPTARRARQ